MASVVASVDAVALTVTPIPFANARPADDVAVLVLYDECRDHYNFSEG
jgi:uncharacterized protein (DUF697 family)